MTDATDDVSRRGFLRGAAGGAALAAGTGAASAAEEGGGAPTPDYGGWFSDVSNFSETTDARGQSEVTIEVGAEGNNGNYAFAPPAVHVDPGTTIVWEWTGKGGGHNVVSDGGAFESSKLTSQAGFTFEQTFDEDGIYKYYCDPHLPLGMKGAVVVGSDYKAKGGGGGGGGPQSLPDSAQTLGVATTAVIAVTLGLAYFFIKYGGDYGDFSGE